MDTTLIYLYSLHNEEHFQFGEDLIELITRTGVSKLKIQEQFDAFAGINRQEEAGCSGRVKGKQRHCERQRSNPDTTLDCHVASLIAMTFSQGIASQSPQR